MLPFTRITVDNREEGKFRSRALNHTPKEYMEALWGYVRGDTAYICAFVKMELDPEKTNSRRVDCKDEQELDYHEDDAAEARVWDDVEGRRINLAFLGTIHSHPDCEDAVPSEHDIRGLLETQESVMAVCAIQKLASGRRRTIVEYWPAVRPFPVERKKNYESFAAAAGKRRAKR